MGSVCAAQSILQVDKTHNPSVLRANFEAGTQWTGMVRPQADESGMRHEAQRSGCHCSPLGAMRRPPAGRLVAHASAASVSHKSGVAVPPRPSRSPSQEDNDASGPHVRTLRGLLALVHTEPTKNARVFIEARFTMHGRSSATNKERRALMRLKLSLITSRRS
jgi:hypothetical protein